MPLFLSFISVAAVIALSLGQQYKMFPGATSEMAMNLSASGEKVLLSEVPGTVSFEECSEDTKFCNMKVNGVSICPDNKFKDLFVCENTALFRDEFYIVDKNDDTYIIIWDMNKEAVDTSDEMKLMEKMCVTSKLDDKAVIISKCNKGNNQLWKMVPSEPDKTQKNIKPEKKPIMPSSSSSSIRSSSSMHSSSSIRSSSSIHSSSSSMHSSSSSASAPVLAVHKYVPNVVIPPHIPGACIKHPVVVNPTINSMRINHNNIHQDFTNLRHQELAKNCIPCPMQHNNMLNSFGKGRLAYAMSGTGHSHAPVPCNNIRTC